MNRLPETTRLGRWATCCLLALGLLLACRDPFVPEIDEFADLLVVEGRLTNDTAGSVVRLSRSIGFEVDSLRPERGASVWIETANGDRFSLAETGPGRYQSNPQQFMPQTGQAYRLGLRTTDGREYASTFETLKPVPPIERLETNFTEREANDPDEPLIQGFDFLVTTRDPEGNTRFYQWEWEETYEFRLSYPVTEDFTFDPTFRAFTLPPGTNTRRCWRLGTNEEILVASSRQLDEDLIESFPVGFLGARSDKANWVYSLLLKQYALSEEEFNFLQTMEQNTETTGSLFDPIPAELRGNLQEVGNPATPVIGYFGASEVAQQRIFVSRDDFPDNTRITRPFMGCHPDTLEFDPLELRGYLEGNYLWYDTAYSEMGAPIGFQVIAAPCGDCRLTGSPEKPAFWPN